MLRRPTLPPPPASVDELLAAAREVLADTDGRLAVAVAARDEAAEVMEAAEAEAAAAEAERDRTHDGDRSVAAAERALRARAELRAADSARTSTAATARALARRRADLHAALFAHRQAVEALALLDAAIAAGEAVQGHVQAIRAASDEAVSGGASTAVSARPVVVELVRVLSPTDLASQRTALSGDVDRARQALEQLVARVRFEDRDAVGAV